jgi:general secretion pathway protein A
MYILHYNLTMKPFSISPDPHFLWLSSIHREAYNILKYGILEDKGFLVLTGEVGTGKTLLINKLVSDCPVPSIIVTIPDPGLRPLDFFHYFAEEAGMEAKFKGKGEFWILLRQFLLQAYEFEKKVLLIIDEAQRLSFKLLEQTRLMSNILKPNKKLINIFFVGQNEFINVLTDKRSQAVMQRVTTKCQLGPFTEDETFQYINHRLAMAGAKTEIFSPEAIGSIYNLSRGLPRTINVICDKLPGGDKKSHKQKEKPIIKPLNDKTPSAAPGQVAAGEQPTTPHRIGKPSEIPVWMQADEPPITPQKHKRVSAIPVQAPDIEYVNDKVSPSPGRSVKKMLLIGLVLGLIGSNLYLIYKVYHPLSQSTLKIYEELLPKEKFFASKNEVPNIVTKKVISRKIEDNESATGNLKNEDAAPPASQKSGLLKESTTVEQLPPEKQIPQILPDIETDTTNLNNKHDDFALNRPVDHKYESTQTQSDIALPEEKIIIYFKHNSNEISEQAYQRLDQIFQIISEYPNSEVIIQGYTDSFGDFTYNRTLSKLRADNVRFYFISKGIDPSRINAVGLGAQNFIATNETREGRNLNRRVEIKIHNR